MLAKIEWDSVNIAGAFLLGAVLATIAMLRVVRAVASLFDEGPHRPPWRRRDERDARDDTSTPDEP